MSNDVPYTWAQANLNEGVLIFDSQDGFERALQDGFFFVEAPANMCLAAGDQFAQHFYLPKGGTVRDRYCDYRAWTADRLAEREGYFLRDEDQVEQFFLESRFWQQVFPPELALQAERMRGFGLDILKAVLAYLPIPISAWEMGTGCCLSGQGTYHLTFNHFRSAVRARGLNIHKDSGWVTILRSLTPGLEVLRRGEWMPITPRPGTFIVNFGCAMEILTRETAKPVAAVAHRVIEQHADGVSGMDRFSYALFIDSSLDEALCAGLYRFTRDRGLIVEANFKEFLNDIVSNTYDKDGKGLY